MFLRKVCLLSPESCWPLEWASALKKLNLKHRRLRMALSRETASSGWKDVVNA